MHLRTMLSLSAGGRLRLLARAAGLLQPFYRLVFVASAARAGALRLLAGGPRSLAEIAAEIAPDPSTHASLAAWLDVGVHLGELAQGPSGYSLSGILARRLADPANDDVAALIEEVVTFHHRLILETPRRWRGLDLYSPYEHDGVLISRSSRILEPFVIEIIDWAFPARGPVRLLEVGCGSGVYLCHAARKNPLLTAVGVEVREPVAVEARRRIARRGLADRIRIEAGDIRDRAPEALFDVVTLHNAIYYFSREERPALLEKLTSLLAPGGRLVVSTSCRGGPTGMRVLDLWTRSTRGFGPLPTETELAEQVRRAGLVDVRTRRPMPGEPYVGLCANKPLALPR